MSKTIQIQFTRKITFSKMVEVSDAVAEEAIALDGEDLQEYNSDRSSNPDFSLITEDLTDSHDVLDAAGEIESLSVTEYKSK